MPYRIGLALALVVGLVGAAATARADGIEAEILSAEGDKPTQAEWFFGNKPPLETAPPKLKLRLTSVGEGRVALLNLSPGKGLERMSTPDVLVPEVVDADGKTVEPITWALANPASPSRSYEVLEKGASRDVPLVDGFLPPPDHVERAAENLPRFTTVFGNRRFDLKPGRYRLRITVDERVAGAAEKLGAVPIWAGKVTTDWFEFAVKAGPKRELPAEELDALAQKIAEQRAPKSPFKPLASPLAIRRRQWNDTWKFTSTNDQPLASPFSRHRFYFLLLGHTPAHPFCEYLCLSPTGEEIVPFDPEKHFAKILAAEDQAYWTLEDYRNAALLYVHLTSFANQDAGWTMLQAADFEHWAADPRGGTLKELSEAALAKIRAPGYPNPPPATRRDGAVVIHFFSWHHIGGGLDEWTFTFGPEFHVRRESLGRFGGGGYE